MMSLTPAESAHVFVAAPETNKGKSRAGDFRSRRGVSKHESDDSDEETLSLAEQLGGEPESRGAASTRACLTPRASALGGASQSAEVLAQASARGMSCGLSRSRLQGPGGQRPPAARAHEIDSSGRRAGVDATGALSMATRLGLFRSTVAMIDAGVSRTFLGEIAPDVPRTQPRLFGPRL